MTTATTSTSLCPDMLSNLDQSSSPALTVILDLGGYLLIQDIAPVEENATHVGGTFRVGQSTRSREIPKGSRTAPRSASAES
jgi:hypothetical protein